MHAERNGYISEGCRRSRICSALPYSAVSCIVYRVSVVGVAQVYVRGRYGIERGRQSTMPVWRGTRTKRVGIGRQRGSPSSSRPAHVESCLERLMSMQRQCRLDDCIYRDPTVNRPVRRHRRELTTLLGLVLVVKSQRACLPSSFLLPQTACHTPVWSC